MKTKLFIIHVFTIICVQIIYLVPRFLRFFCKVPGIMRYKRNNLNTIFYFNILIPK